MRGHFVELFLVAIALLILFQRRVWEAIIEALNNFRGGPPSAGHPLPADDGFLLRSRRKPRTGL